MLVFAAIGVVLLGDKIGCWCRSFIRWWYREPLLMSSDVRELIGARPEETVDQALTRVRQVNAAMDLAQARVQQTHARVKATAFKAPPNPKKSPPPVPPMPMVKAPPAVPKNASGSAGAGAADGTEFQQRMNRAVSKATGTARQRGSAAFATMIQGAVAEVTTPIAMPEFGRVFFPRSIMNPTGGRPRKARSSSGFKQSPAQLNSFVKSGSQAS